MATSASGPSRRFVVGLLLVLALLSAVAATVAVWARAYVVDTDRWVETMGPLIEEPEVVAAVGRRGAQAVVDGLDLEELIRRSPEAVRSLAPGASPEALTAAVQDRLAGGIEAVLETDLARRLWVGINRAAHRSALALVRGETREGAEVTDGTVSLNLLPLIQLALDEAEDLLSDVLGRPIDVPRPDDVSVADADAARTQIEAALGLDLSEDFGEVVVLRSDRLGTLQDGFAAIDRAVLWIVVLAVALAAATVLLSTDRPRTLLALGVGMVVAFVAAGLAVRLLERVLADLASEENRDAAREVVAAVFASLLTATTVLAAAGAVVGVVAYLAGRPARLRSART